jgi:photosystem II stability/assembly factor-like uncharacterized protein
MGEEGTERAKRTAWFELLHQAAPGTDWKKIEYQNRIERHRNRAASAFFRNNCQLESFADGYFSGFWKEWGSSNQAGSVFDTEYDPNTNEIWLISAGGTLWKGLISGSQWEVVNQDLRFTPGMLQFMDYGDSRRLIAFTGRLPHYSDDEGYTWTPATGITHNDRWGDIHSPMAVAGETPAVYVLAKPSYWADIQLYRSVDYGETYLPVSSFNTEDFRKLKLISPHHSNQLYLIEKMSNNSAKIYRANHITGQLEWINEQTNLNYGGARANMTGTVDQNGTLHLYIYTNPQEGVWQVHHSTDEGISWNYRGDLPVSPWSVGLYVSPSNPQLLLMGAVECYRSTNGGQSWEKKNDWWDYYDDVEGSLHADIMHFSEYKNANGQDFLLVSNHGGISISYDELQTVQNIGMNGLNVSQYYSVRTDPTDPQFVYAGSQDQGFQRSADFDEHPPGEFEQVISGDYGHIVFGDDGQSLWTVYPGGWVTHYNNPKYGGIHGSYDLASEEESVWLPPLMASPFPEDDAIYMAGGNINGGPGSYLIRLNPEGNQIEPEQINFNFSENSGGGQLSSMATAPADYFRWYAATTNGRFFFSEDGGYEWEQSLNFLPEGHYLYGQTICVSNSDPMTVYLGGSGYSNPAVYKSTDGGHSFEPMDNGLPSTLVFGLVSNEDESLLFAATEAGPYVYVTENEQWYDLAGQCAPAQTYWSVEYLPAERIARFGTYGRGIWDFEVETMVNTTSAPARSWKIYPNPASDWLKVDLPAGSWQVALYHSDGAQARSIKQANGYCEINLEGLPAGIYQVRIFNGKEQWVEQAVIR